MFRANDTLIPTTSSLICIFYNGETPFINRLHSQANGTAAYRYTDGSYVDRVTSGEVLKVYNRPEDRAFLFS